MRASSIITVNQLNGLLHNKRTDHLLHLSPQHLVILVLAGDVAEWTWISIGLACTQKLRHLDVIHLHLRFLIIFFHNFSFFYFSRLRREIFQIYYFGSPTSSEKSFKSFKIFQNIIINSCFIAPYQGTQNVRFGRFLPREGHLFYNYLFTIHDVHAFLRRFSVQLPAVQRVPCFAVEADFTSLGVDGSDGCDITVSIHEAYGHP